MASLPPLKQRLALRPEYIASSTRVIKVDQHSASWSSGNFTITESNTDEKLFGVTGEFASFTQRRHFSDASGLPLFELSRERMGMKWFLHLPGEKSRKAKEKETPYSSPAATKPIATFVPKYSALMDKFDMHFRNSALDSDPGADWEEVTLSIWGQNVWKSRANVYHCGRLAMTVKLTNMAAPYIPLKRPTWEASVAEGMDLSLASVVAVFLAMMLYESNWLAESNAPGTGN
ncbi:tubby C-terminal-like domain-containing protein [Aspergillus foveolatus]|uniref:tubby C-terminal-like domain-containing protein n=1 Tax=Aspergillus foveolatus TaxID=210207 RepID=UPI003CCE2342